MSFDDSHWGRPNQKDPSDDKKKRDGQQTDASQAEQPQDRSDTKDHVRPTNARNNREQDKINGINQDIDSLWSDLIASIGESKNKKQRSKVDKNVDYTRRDDFGDDRAEDGVRSTPDASQQAGNVQGRKIPSIHFKKTSKPGKQEMEIGLRIPKKFFGFVRSSLFLGLLAAWGATGFYIVPEGQTGVVTQFGKYYESTAPGLRWHLPMPIQTVRLVDVSRVRTVTIGGHRNRRIAERALMLTDDENIVDVQFTVQYRIKPMRGARDYLFNTRNPEASIIQTAESAMREVVGRKAMDSVLFESKAEIAMNVQQLMQAMLDRYATGLEVMSVAIQNAQPPAPVQAAFNDAVKAGQDRERAINLGEAYMNAVLPQARGTASRLTEEAAAYKARVVETARGDAARFKSVYDEYKKAPEVTRDRLYIDTMRDVYKSVSKVVVDTKNSNPMLYVPLEQLIQQTKNNAQNQAQASVKATGAISVEPSANTTTTEPSTPTTRRSLERFRE